MKANELRIGNYLHDQDGDLCKVVKLEQCEDRQIYAPVIVGPITKLPNKPIPLTEEWFLKLGFVWDLKHCKWSFGEFYLIQFDSPIYLIKGYEDLKIELKYVHQLQNLYYAHKNEELTITI